MISMNRGSCIQSLGFSVDLQVVSCGKHLFSVQNAEDVLKENLDPFSESSSVGGPWLNTQWLTKSFATSPADIRFLGIAFTSFVNRSVITRMYF